MLDPDDLTPADEAVLELMRSGRVTAPYAAEETEYTIQYVRDTLTNLRKHGHVRRVHKGLYELVDDPRENSNDG
jgi:DeoR/GlpR family transcriptional regulator of sugar metabolism